MTIDEIRKCNIPEGEYRLGLASLQDDIAFYSDSSFFVENECRELVDSLVASFSALHDLATDK